MIISRLKGAPKPEQLFRVMSDIIVNNNKLDKVIGHDANRRALLQDKTTSSCYTWKIERVPVEPFLLKDIESGKYLDIEGAKQGSGSVVVLYALNKAINQQWYEDANGIIRSKLNDMTLDTSEGTLKMRPFDWNADHRMWTVQNREAIYNIRLNKYMNKDLKVVDQKCKFMPVPV
eukprot:GHVO01004916.1.p1 GENE.GHVO01004916.1~~GHVO01004916.1.p1  ORF type:complete len:175 (-),score=23.27 GHVO01004916.1:168-692(-)